LRLIGLALGAATKAGVPIAMCGEMAGEQRLTRLFLGMGLREFSMHPSELLAVKQRVLQTNVGAGAALVERIRRVDDPEKLEALLDRLNA
ncbi:MAG TPA: putative PEP-binding protein, partial [Casimicrobiaceae bacterium]|nr:putative PEP-binding protein [Casimicrobiaceae bacterium]